MSDGDARAVLQQPVQAGDLALAHRVVLAPLTRMRATADAALATPLHATYYAQRASRGGLLVSEAINVTRDSCAYPRTPGLWSAAQARAWRDVTRAVHARGGRIVAQLWHTGRVASRVHGGRSVGASDVPLPGRGDERVAPLSAAELRALPGVYRRAARLALDAGFDGVEVHGAHGYLLDQFLNDGTNRRRDAWGGSVANRARLLLDVLDAVVAECGAGRVALRLSPHCAGSIKYYGVDDSDPDALYAHVVRAVAQRKLAYLLLTEPRWTGRAKHDNAIELDPSFRTPLINGPKFRPLYDGVMIGAGGFTPAGAVRAVREGVYDLVAFGRWFIANPDLPARLFNNQPLNRYNRARHEYIKYFNGISFTFS